MHPGYGAMPRAPVSRLSLTFADCYFLQTEFDALSEMSFGSEANVNNIQSRKHIRQLLHEHFTRDQNRPNDASYAPHATYQRGNSRNRPSNTKNHTSSTQEAAFTEYNHNHNHREMVNQQIIKLL